jgi:hypothetical protein
VQVAEWCRQIGGRGTVPGRTRATH